MKVSSVFRRKSTLPEGRIRRFIVRMFGWSGTLLLCSAFIVLRQPLVFAQTPVEFAKSSVERALHFYKEGRLEEALKVLDDVLRIEPENFDAWYYKGLLFLVLDQSAQALSALEKARSLRREDLEVNFHLGVLYFGRQQYELAEPLLNQVYQVDPARPNLGYYLGFMEYRKKNYRVAIEYFRANVPSDENFQQLAQVYTGLAMGALGFPKEGSAELGQALRLQPDSPLTVPARRFGEVLERAAALDKPLRGELRAGIFYDTNVPVVPNASSDLVGEAIREDQKRRKSGGELASLELAYTWLKTLDWEGTLSHRFFQTYNNHLTKFNTQSHTPSVSLVRRGVIRAPPGNMPYYAGIGYTYDFITIGNARFVQRWIIDPYFTLVENSSNMTHFQYRLQVKDFFDDDDVVRREVRDALNSAVGPTHYFLFEGGLHYIKIGYQYDYDGAEGKNWTYWGNRALVGGHYTLPWQNIRLRYDLDYHHRSYKYRNSLIPATAPNTKERRDGELAHFVSVAKDFHEGRLTISLDYLFDDNRSNLDAYAYKRHVITTSLTWRF